MSIWGGSCPTSTALQDSDLPQSKSPSPSGGPQALHDLPFSSLPTPPPSLLLTPSAYCSFNTRPVLPPGPLHWLCSLPGTLPLLTEMTCHPANSSLRTLDPPLGLPQHLAASRSQAINTCTISQTMYLLEGWDMSQLLHPWVDKQPRTTAGLHKSVAQPCFPGTSIHDTPTR